MSEPDIAHRYDYSQEYLSDILRSVRTIAMVGASADKTKFSYGVLRVLHETGYDIIPVNPNPAVTEIRGIPVYRSLAEIDRPVDMVEVFRPKEELYGIAEQAIAIDAKVLGADRRLRRPRREAGRRGRAEGGHGSLSEDRAVPPVLETPARPRDLRRPRVVRRACRKGSRRAGSPRSVRR